MGSSKEDERKAVIDRKRRGYSDGSSKEKSLEKPEGEATVALEDSTARAFEMSEVR